MKRILLGLNGLKNFKFIKIMNPFRGKLKMNKSEIQQTLSMKPKESINKHNTNITGSVKLRSMTKD